MKEQVIKHIKETLEIEGKVLHCDLLRAILEHLGSEYRVTIWARSPDTWDIVYRMSQTTSELKISLNHRHIEDIPDDDAMWEQLLTILKS